MDQYTWIWTFYPTHRVTKTGTENGTSGWTRRTQNWDLVNLVPLKAQFQDNWSTFFKKSLSYSTFIFDWIYFWIYCDCLGLLPLTIQDSSQGMHKAQNGLRWGLGLSYLSLRSTQFSRCCYSRAPTQGLKEWSGAVLSLQSLKGHGVRFWDLCFKYRRIL